MKKLLLAFALTLGFHNVASASFVEVKLSYSMLASKPDLEEITGSTSAPTAVPSYGLGYDVLVQPPLIPIGIGLRQENLGFSVDSNGIDVTSKLTRTALVINSRFLDTGLYVGPVFTYGISHSASLDTEVSGVESSFEPDSISSYSLGVEVGIHLGFLIGAEAGYMNVQLKGMEDKNGIITGSSDENMNGTYAKVFVGFAF